MSIGEHVARSAHFTVLLKADAQIVQKRINAGRPGDALSLLGDMADTLDLATRHMVAGLRAVGCTWSEIGVRLGVSRQAAWEKYSTPPTE